MKWWRVLGLGVGLWALPFLASVVLFAVRESNRPLFESMITVVGVILAVVASLYYFRDAKGTDLLSGLVLGTAWLAISVIIDLPIFIFLFAMSPAEYFADIAVSYLSFPAITTGIAMAQARASNT
jgi:ABC-type amino acid transport system permease subunit